jgi:hypothetical protein
VGRQPPLRCVFLVLSPLLDEHPIHPAQHDNVSLNSKVKLFFESE